MAVNSNWYKWKMGCIAWGYIGGNKYISAHRKYCYKTWYSVLGTRLYVRF